MDVLCVTLTGMAYSLNALVSAMRSIMLVIAPFAKPFMNSGPAIQGFFIFSILFDLCVIFGQYYMVTNEQNPRLTMMSRSGILTYPEFQNLFVVAAAAIVAVVSSTTAGVLCRESGSCHASELVWP